MSRWLTVAIVLICAGCSHHVYSPPSRLAPLRSPDTVGEGRVAATAAFSFGGQVLGPDYVGMQARTRYGLTPTLELEGAATVVEIEGGDPAADTHPFIYAGHAGLKWAPAAVGRFVALTAGVGGGWSAAGGFVSPEAGFVLGFENPYLVPFVDVAGLVSVPVDPRPVDTSSVDDGAGTRVDTPELTYGVRWTPGVRLPFTYGTGHQGAFYLVWSFLELWDASGEDGLFMDMSGGFEVAF